MDPRSLIGPTLLVLMLIAATLAGLVQSERLVSIADAGLYEDSIIFDQATPYQQITVTRFQDRVRLFLDHVKKVATAHEIQRHVRGLVVFEHLMHADDIRMLELRQTPRFGTKMLHDRVEFRLVLTRTGHDVTVIPAAHRRREAFLDDNDTIQTIARKIRHPKATGVQEFLNPELSVQKLGTRLQRVSKRICMLRACVHFSPKFVVYVPGLCAVLFPTK